MINPIRPPDAGPTRPECGWTLGFRLGERCTEPPAEGGSLCAGHLKADRRIAEYAKEAAWRAERDLDRFYGGMHELRVLLDPRAIAERWWVETGVRQIPSAIRREVLASGPCAYCGHREPDEIDHIFPVSRGGTSERTNLAPACRRCNAEKLDSTVDEWREWRLGNGMSWPPKTIQQLVKDVLGRLVEADPPPPFLADLVNMPVPEVLPEICDDDPRWKTALRVLGEDDPSLSWEAKYMRRMHASQLMHDLQVAYESQEP